MATGCHIGNVTLKQIDIESCVIPLILLILALRIHFWHRFCILTSPTIKIQDGRLLPFRKCNFKVNGHRKPCNITFPTKRGIESPFLIPFFCILMSLNIKIQDGRHLPIFSVFSHIAHITCWISHEKLVFSNMCLFPGVVSCILTSPNIKIQDSHQRPYWKIDSKENSSLNRSYYITFPINYCITKPIPGIICVFWQVWMSNLKVVAICHFHCFEI